MNTAFASLIEDEWRKTLPGAATTSAEPPGLFWSYAVTPPFPARWPPDGGRRVFGYLFATCLDPRVMDGVRVAAPWGRLEYCGGEQHPPRFVRLSETIREIGIQGVRPVTGEEMAVYGGSGRAVAALESLGSIPDGSDPDTHLLREYYRTWSSHNGVIVRELYRIHEPFFRWIDRGRGDG